MEAKTEVVDDITIVTLPGEKVDAGNVPEFKRDVVNALPANAKVIFDMSELKFVDSSGLGAILSCLRRLNSSGGDLKLCGLSKSVRALFELVRMHRIFDICNTREEALESYKQ